MKKFLLLLYMILLFALIPISTVMAQWAAYDEGVVWILEPELEYDNISYCAYCNVLKDVVDISDIKEEIEKRNDNGAVNIHADSYILFHMWKRSYSYFFDEKKGIFVIVYFVGGENYGGFDYYTLNEFDECMKSRWGDYENYLIILQKINFNKDKYDVNFEKDGGVDHYDYEEYCDFYGKYALTSGTNFITGFNYDSYKATDPWFRGITFMGFQLNDKWGIVDKNGKAIIPFIFDNIEFIDEQRAFAKYNGKYGILDVEKTSLELAFGNYAPLTSDDNAIYAYVLSFVLAFIISVFSLKKLSMCTDCTR